MLINAPSIGPPPIAAPQKTSNPIKRIRDEHEKILQTFWKVWRKEYLVTFMQREKWVREREPIKIGQLVFNSNGMENGKNSRANSEQR